MTAKILMFPNPHPGPRGLSTDESWHMGARTFQEACQELDDAIAELERQLTDPGDDAA